MPSCAGAHRFISLSQNTDECHFDVCRLARTTDHVKRSFCHRFEVQVPVPLARRDNETRYFIVAVVGLEQIHIGTIGKMLIAEHHVKRISNSKETTSAWIWDCLVTAGARFARSGCGRVTGDAMVIPSCLVPTIGDVFVENP